MTEIVPTKLLTAERAAELLAVKPSWLLREARHNRVPCVRLGPRYVRFDPESLEAWWRRRIDGPVGNRP